MRTLYLLRHAKSSSDDPELADSERPLAPRGRDAIAAMADHMRAAGVAPDLVICSPAVRARQTLKGLGDAIGSPPVDIEPRLYEANESDLLAVVRGVDDGIPSMMMIGHNPSIERLALLLAAESDLLDALRSKFPTAALATLAADASGWRDLEPGRAQLEAFVRPRDLERAP